VLHTNKVPSPFQIAEAKILGRILQKLFGCRPDIAAFHQTDDSNKGYAKFEID
jgi:hypothetical protein